MRQLALRTLRFRLGAFVAAFLAILCAATIMMSCGGLIETGIRTAVPPQQLSSADIVVAGEQAYHATGGDPDEPVILPERVRVDAMLEETIADLPGVRSTESHVFDGEPAAGRVDAIGVVVEPGVDVDQVREQIDSALDEQTTTLVGDERGRAELREALETGVNVVALAGVFTAFAILVTIFGVASMLALSVTQRHRELALLRAVGATPRQLRRLILGETLVLAVLATAVGVLPAQLLGRFVFGALVDRGIATDGVAFHQGWIPTVAAAAVAIVSAVAGAVGAGRRAARVKPTQALAEAALEGRTVGPVRVVLALLMLAGGVAMAVVTIAVMSGPLAAATAAPAVILLTIGLALLAPVLTKILTFVVQWPVRAWGGVTGELAVLNAHGRSGRLAAVTAPVILLTGVASGMLYLQATNDEADRRAFADGLRADAVVTSQGPLDPDLVGQIDDLPGVAGASEHVTSTGFIEEPEDRSPMGEGWTLQGVTPETASATTPVAVAEGTLTDLSGDTVALEEDHARELGVGLGDTITLRLGDNTALDTELVAIFAADDDFDTLLIPADTLSAHTTDGFTRQVVVTAQPGVDLVDLEAELTALIADYDGLTISDREVLLDAFDEQRQTSTFAIYLMVLMIAGYAAITVVNTLASSTTTRRREFGLLRLAGFTRTQVLRMVGIESLIVALGGLAVGTVAALGIVVPVAVKRLNTMVPAGSPWLYVSIVALVVLLTWSATFLPTWRATRGRPAESALAIE
jgi:putative ABC transport system permease protein